MNSTPGPASSSSQTLYRFFDAAGVLLYVGITGDAATRWKAHSKAKGWWPQVATVKVEHFAARPDVEAAEVAAIKAERPVFNVVHNAVGRIAQPNWAYPSSPQHFTDGCDTCPAMRLTQGSHEPHRTEAHPDGLGLDAWYRCSDGHEWYRSWGDNWIPRSGCQCACAAGRMLIA